MRLETARNTKESWDYLLESNIDKQLNTEEYTYIYNRDLYIDSKHGRNSNDITVTVDSNNEKIVFKVDDNCNLTEYRRYF
jgi:hypothetical protein